MKRILSAAAALIAAVLPFCGQIQAAAPKAPGISARCAILMDADSGTVLYERQANQKSLIASTTKIMTGYLVCREMDLDASVTVPPEAEGVEGSSMYLRAGEEMTVRDLLLGLMLHSGNDAAEALSILCDGSEEAFVDRMNQTAEDLGLTATSYANPHGLDSENNYSTARDLARLAAAALENDTFRQTVSTKSAMAAGRALTNHNKLLWHCPGCIGVKTGYTKAAGRILVSAAEREGRRLICVTINAPDDWRDHRALLDWGFSQYEPRPLARKGETLCRLRTAAAAEQAMLAEADLTVPMLPSEEVRLEFLPDFVPALSENPGGGTVRLWLGHRLLAEVRVRSKK